MTDIRTKALALAALENEVLIWWDELHDRYVAALDNRKVAVSDEIDIGLVELYAEAAKVLGLEPDPVIMELFETKTRGESDAG